MSTQNKYQFLDEILETKSQAEEYIGQLEMLAESLYNKKKSLNEKADTFMTADLARNIKSVFQQKNLNGGDPSAAEKVLEEISSYIKKMPVVELRIAFEPTNAVINKIHGWFNTNLKERILLHIIIDRKIIGGAIVGYKGVYKDYSLRKLLKKTVAEPQQVKKGS